MAKADKWRRATSLNKITRWASDENNTAIIIAKKIGVHISTFYRWLIKYPEIKEAYENGRAIVDEKVETALIKSCIGFHHTATKYDTVVSKRFNQNGRCIEECEKLVPVETDVYIPPSVTALEFYLCNHMPESWRAINRVLDLTEKEVSENTGVVKLPEVREVSTAAERPDDAAEHRQGV